jgi:hypothetical protein
MTRQFLLATTIIVALLMTQVQTGARERAPAPAAEAGYTTQTFGPKMLLGSNWVRFNSGVHATQNTEGSVTIRGGGNDFNAQVLTAAPNDNGTYTGKIFCRGGYFEATLAFAGPPVMAGGWPSFWANDIENQIQARTGNGASQWLGQAKGYVNSIETDFMEFLSGPGSYGIAMHNWYGYQRSIQNVSTTDSGSPVTLPPGTNTFQPHKYGFLWIPATTAMQGIAKWFFDRQQVGNTVAWDRFNPSAPPPPVAGKSAYSVLDSRGLYLILGTGPSNPMTVYSVSVWQRPPAKEATDLEQFSKSPCATRGN